MKKLALVALIGVFMSACGLTGEELGRIKNNQLSTEGNYHPNSVELELNAGDKLSYWTDLNIEFEGDLALEYQVQLIHNQDTLGIISLNPFEKDITIGEVKTTAFNKTSWRYSARLMHFDISESGTYRFTSIILASPNESLKLNKADLVFKR